MYRQLSLLLGTRYHYPTPTYSTSIEPAETETYFKISVIIKLRLSKYFLHSSIASLYFFIIE